MQISPSGMSRKRALISDAFNLKKRRNGTEQFGATAAEEGGCVTPKKIYNNVIKKLFI